jgi:hypothetical protein
MGGRWPDDCNRRIGRRTRSILLLFSHGEMMTNTRRNQYKLTRLLAAQTDFLGNVKTTPTEREGFHKSLDRVRELV